jgi:hypothetical protein
LVGKNYPDLIGIARKAFDFYPNFNNIQTGTLLAQDMQKNTKKPIIAGVLHDFFRDYIGPLYGARCNSGVGIPQDPQ